MRHPALAIRSFRLLFLAVSSASIVAACSGDAFVPTGSGAGGNAAGAAGGIGGGVPGGSGGGGGSGGSGGNAGGASGSAGTGGAPSGGNAGTGGAPGGGQGGSSACANDDACNALAGVCRKGACSVGQCVFVDDDTRLPPNVPNDCRKPSCEGGKPDLDLDLDDPPDVDAPCSTGVCNPDGTPGTKPANDGTTCETGRFCDKGFCVGCSMQRPCPTYGANDCRISTGCEAGLCGEKANPDGKPDDQPNDCLAKKCLPDGSVGTSFEQKGKNCTDGETLVGKCNDKGECLPLVPTP